MAGASEQYILYLQSLQTIVCQLCHFGIAKGGIRLHFERHHKSIPINERRALEEYIKQFNVCEIKSVERPSREITAIEGLKIHEGFICMWENCSHLRTTPTSMKQHCFEVHGWIKSKGVSVSCQNSLIRNVLETTTYTDHISRPEPSILCGKDTNDRDKYQPR